MNHYFNRSKVIFGCGVVYTKKVFHLSVGKNGTEIVRNGATDAGQDNKTLSM